MVAVSRGKERSTIDVHAIALRDANEWTETAGLRHKIENEVHQHSCNNNTPSSSVTQINTLKQENKKTKYIKDTTTHVVLCIMAW